MRWMRCVYVQVARAMILAYSSVRASRSLHARLIEKIMRLPMSFFDSQPTGEPSIPVVHAFPHGLPTAASLVTLCGFALLTYALLGQFSSVFPNIFASCICVTHTMTLSMHFPANDSAPTIVIHGSQVSNQPGFARSYRARLNQRVSLGLQLNDHLLSVAVQANFQQTLPSAPPSNFCGVQGAF